MRPHTIPRPLLRTAEFLLIPLVALVIWPPIDSAPAQAGGGIAWTPSVPAILALNMIFVALWITAAWLFRKAAVITP